MKTKYKVLIGLGAYLAVAIALLLIFGNEGKNEHFKPQNEFKLPPWIEIKIGPIDFSINRAVLYLFIASVLTIVTMTYIAKRMAQK
ncbi:MAG: F0F1 ATP synthase subunit A, partial [Actinobacteria bacterium]|nr:F0F1 ATP synthase subunit A [Actinomycetota bacterium]